ITTSTTIDNTPPPTLITDEGNPMDDTFNEINPLDQLPFLFWNDDINNRASTVITTSTNIDPSINTDAGNPIDDTFNQIMSLKQLPFLAEYDDINNRTSTVITTSKTIDKPHSSTINVDAGISIDDTFNSLDQFPFLFGNDDDINSFDESFISDHYN
ncbi:391_t:CDS:1, partial [Ambispora leptoticha]